MCRISLNQIEEVNLRKITFKKTGLPIYYEKKEKLNKINKIKYELSMINYKGCTNKEINHNIQSFV